MSASNEPVGPNPDSAFLMSIIDRMSPAVRKLVHEYGYTIVQSMRENGVTKARDMKPILELWRERRQEEWLVTNYVTSLKLFREFH